MKDRIKRISASLLAAVMLFTYMPVFGLGAIADVYAAQYSDVSIRVIPDVPDQPYNNGDEIDLSGVDSLQTLTVKIDDIARDVPLTINEDYTVAASSTQVGEAYVIFTGINEFEGVPFRVTNSIPGARDKVYFNIVDPDPDPSTSSYETTIDKTGFVHGERVTANTVKAVTKVVKDDTSFVPSRDIRVEVTGDEGNARGYVAGNKYSVVVSVRGTNSDWFEVKTDTIEIAKKDLADCTVSAYVAEGSKYNAEPQEPVVSNVRVGRDAFEEADYTVSYNENVNAGDAAEAIITATEDNKYYTGSTTKYFSIAPATIDNSSELVLDGEAKSYVYTGEEQKQPVDLKLYFTKSVQAKAVPTDDYKTAYLDDEDYTNAGDKRVTVEASDDNHNLFVVKGDDAVAAVKGYTITAANLSDVTVEQNEAVYPGEFDWTSDQFSVKLGDVDVTTQVMVTGVEGDDTVGSTRTVALKPVLGNRNFTGTTTFTYVVADKDLDPVYVSRYSTVYTGQSQVPTKTDLLSGRTYLRSKSDVTHRVYDSEFEIDNRTFKNNIHAGTATVEIEGKGSYAGKRAVVEFTIAPIVIADTDITVTGLKDGSYCEGAEISGLTVTYGSGESAVDLSNDVVVTAKEVENNKLTAITVTCKEGADYSGSVDKTVDVASADVSLSGATITGTINAGLTRYNEAAVKNAIEVKVGNTVIPSDSYSLTITSPSEGRGDLGTTIEFKIEGLSDAGTRDSKTGSVEVVQRDMADFAENVTVSARASYRGTEWKPGTERADGSVSVSTRGTGARNLVKDTDYTLSYESNIDAGTATVTLTGIGNYKGSVSETFEISPVRLRSSDVAWVETPEVEYQVGKVDDLSDSLAVKAAEGRNYVLTEDDYEISLATDPTATVPAGSSINYNVAIKEGGNYREANLTLPITVSPKHVTEAEITLDDKPISETVFVTGTYLDETDFADLVVKVDGETLTAGTDYAVQLKGQFDPVLLPGEGGEDYVAPFIEIAFNPNKNANCNYVGIFKEDLTIAAKDPEDVEFDKLRLTAPKASALVYGQSATFEPTVTYIGSDAGLADAVRLDPYDNAYYKVVYTKDGEVLDSAPAEAGTYTATLVATETYGGQSYATVDYTVTQKKLSKAEFKEFVADVTAEPVEYFGESTEAPELTGVNADQFKVVYYDKEWDGEEAEGNAVIALDESSNYAFNDTVDLTFVWEKGDISNMKVSDFFEIEAQYYTGSDVCPTTVKAKEGVDLNPAYVVFNSYGSNVEKGTKTAYAMAQIVVPDTDKKYTGTTRVERMYFDIIEDPVRAQYAASAKAIIDAAKEYIDDTYPAEARTNVQSKIDALNALLADDKSTIDEIQAAIIALATAVGEADEAKAIADAKSEADKKEAEAKAAAVQEAILAVAEAAKVTEANKYPADAVTDVAKAQKTLELTMSLDGATAADIKAKADALNAAIKLADAKKSATKITEANGYTASSVKAVANAVKTNNADKINEAVKAAKKKVANTMTVKAKTVKVKATKKTKIKKSKAFKVKKAKGKVTFQKVSGNKKITVSSKGKVTVKKGLKAGKTYKVKVKVTAAGNGDYLAKTKTVTLKVKVKKAKKK